MQSARIVVDDGDAARMKWRTNGSEKIGATPLVGRVVYNQSLNVHHSS